MIESGAIIFYKNYYFDRCSFRETLSSISSADVLG